ncbi:MAG: hypothetical protein A2901_05335 [Elusimicrobia bacterium RIFCSPLOWO2_01_FULL_54_10]|nr:MAG: hypothetical protein A2901_05335 [Elusimicrobia bacterium RIFCSPLOWO2_01_FULL_54_10]
MFVVLVGVLALNGFAFLFIGGADALQLTSRSDTLETSDHAVTDVIHTFVFDTASAITTAVGADDFSIVINFPTGTGGAPTDPYAMPNFAAGDVAITGDAGCGNVAGFSVVAVTESSNDGADGNNDEVVIEITDDDNDAVNIPIGCTFTIVLGLGATAMDNPVDNPDATHTTTACTDGATAADADVCSIAISTTEDIDGGASPTILDTGDVLVAHISDVTVSVTVEENLTFAISVPAEAACEASFADYGAGRYATVASSSVDFGNVSTFEAFFNGCQDLEITTNALNGYAVTTQSDTSLQEAGGTEIDSGICDNGTCTATVDDTWADPTVATGDTGFAYSCDSVQGAGLCNLGTESTDYKRFPCIGAAADCSPTNSETPQTVFSAAGPSDHIARVEYKISISPTQPASVYTTQVTYVATPVF